MPRERRTEPREALVLPVRVASVAHGVTRDVSESGVFLETGFDHELGSVLDIEFTFDLPAACFRFTAKGAVVRIEHNGENLGLAVKLHAMDLSTVE